MKLPAGLAMVMGNALGSALTDWAEDQQRRISREGSELSTIDLEFAQSLGMEGGKDIRVLVVDRIALPVPAWCVAVARRCGMPVFSPGGMALGNAVVFCRGCEHSLRHELVHVRQYQRLGGIKAFLKEYFTQCLRDGYWEAALEVEARELSAGITNTGKMPVPLFQVS